MQNKTAKKLNIPMRIAGVLLVLVMISAYSISGLYARYTTSAEGSDSAKVAKWVFNVYEEKTVEIAVDQIKTPGNFCEYTFSISNGDGTTVSEVTQKFVVKLEQFGTLPLQYELEELNEDGTEKETKTASASDVGIITFLGNFETNTAKTIKYKLRIEWPDTSKAYVEDGLTVVYLTVRSEQID